MSNRTIRILLWLSAFAIAGLITLQAYWVYHSYKIRKSQFHQTVMIALRKTAEAIAKFNNSKLPSKNLIQHPANNYYVVNINSPIDPTVLEYYLLKEFEAHHIEQPFEYGIYDCATNELVYGNCCNLDDKVLPPSHRKRLDVKDLVYYFVVRFPKVTPVVLKDMWLSWAFSGIVILVSFFLAYSIYIILRQKRYSEVQRDFINNLTHEFKTPITAISLAAQTLEGESTITSDPRLQRYVHLIAAQAKRLHDQVEKILDAARLPKKLHQLKPSTVDINAVVKALAEEWKPRIEREHGQLHTHLYAQNAKVSADEVHLINMLNTLIDNAVKYKKDVPHVTILTMDTPDGPRLVVEDRGIGIDEKDRNKLFQRFYRISTGNVHNVKGFGLGLYYAAQIAKAHGWKISVVSQKGRGSRFIIDFHTKH